MSPEKRPGWSLLRPEETESVLGVTCPPVSLLYSVIWFLTFEGPNSSFPSLHPYFGPQALKKRHRCPFFHALQLQPHISLIAGHRFAVILSPQGPGWSGRWLVLEVLPSLAPFVK